MPAGRPSDYSDEMAALICTELAEGVSLRAVCRREEMPDLSTVFRWLAKHDTFREQYIHAREIQCETLLEEIFDIADDNGNDLRKDENGNEVTNHDVIARAKLRVDTRKWAMSKLAPKKYGDRVVTELTGKDGAPIQTEDVTDPVQVARRMAFILAKGAAQTKD